MLTVTVAPATLDLTDVATAQRELLLDQVDLSALGPVITRASEICADWCGRLHDGHVSEFAAHTVQQTERCVARPCILLDRDLNLAVTAVTVDGTALDTDEYEIEGRRLFRLDSDTRIPWTADKVVITYTTGWTLLGGLPRSIEAACIQVMAYLLAQRGEDPMERRTDNGLLSVVRMDTEGGIPPTAAALLARWKRVHL